MGKQFLRKSILYSSLYGGTEHLSRLIDDYVVCYVVKRGRPGI